jgi:hypothetical protein
LQNIFNLLFTFSNISRLICFGKTTSSSAKERQFGVRVVLKNVLFLGFPQNVYLENVANLSPVSRGPK